MGLLLKTQMEADIHHSYNKINLEPQIESSYLFDLRKKESHLFFAQLVLNNI